MTDSERADQIVAEIDGAIVAHTLESGEPWSKRDHDILIPFRDFDILRRYYEWTRVGSRPAGTTISGNEQVIDLPRARVYNGGTIAEIQIQQCLMAFNDNGRWFTWDKATHANRIYAIGEAWQKLGVKK